MLETLQDLLALAIGWPALAIAIGCMIAGLSRSDPRWMLTAAVLVAPLGLYLSANPGARWGILILLPPLLGAMAVKRLPALAMVGVAGLAAFGLWLALAAIGS